MLPGERTYVALGRQVLAEGAAGGDGIGLTRNYAGAGRLKGAEVP
jgi:hypothetical protein